MRKMEENQMEDYICYDDLVRIGTEGFGNMARELSKNITIEDLREERKLSFSNSFSDFMRILFLCKAITNTEQK